ncbi:PEPKR2 [Symbiodinium sp. CCMP2592]|nr:PEPKR2 [Symbiodinium sp. CCMP2592]
MDEAASGVSQLPWKHMKQESICMTCGCSSAISTPTAWATSCSWDLRETYDAVRPCGQGLHGTVFVGESKASPSRRTQGRKVAVKVTDSDEDRVRREVGFMFQTGEHPNIVSLLGVFGVEKADASFKRERYALVMELGSSGDLGALLARGVLPEFRGTEIMIGVMSALAFLHSQRIVHRDVKPENVVLHADHRPMLVDFSIAASLDDPTALLRSSGSPGYAAPEIVEQRAHCEKVDVFGAGALWYTLMSGRLPFPGNSTKEILANSRRCDVELAMSSCPECNEPRMQSLLKGMLARNPSERPSALECFKSFWQLSEAARGTPASVDSMVAMASLGLTPKPKLPVPERPTPGESASGGSNVSDIASEAKSKALVEELSLSASASNMMELVVKTFCLQRLHVCGTVLTVSAH